MFIQVSQLPRASGTTASLIIEVFVDSGGGKIGKAEENKKMPKPLQATF